MDKDGIAKPVTLAFNREVYDTYSTALDSGDTDTVKNLRRGGRIWTVPFNTKGQIVEKANYFDVRIEILSGPMKGRKGWGTIVDIWRGAEKSKQIPK